MMAEDLSDLIANVGWLKGSMTQLSEQVKLLAQEQRHSTNNLRQSIATLTSRIDKMSGPDEDTESRIRQLEDSKLAAGVENKLRARVERFVCAIGGGGIVALVNFLRDHFK